MSEKVKYLEFKDKSGKTVSVAMKTEAEDKTGKLTLYLSAPSDQVVSTIDEVRYKAQFKKLTNS